MSAGSSILQHQFDDLEQQREASTIGIWIFLATEVMFFGGLFLCFAVYRTFYTEGFSHAAQHMMHVKEGTINTAVLLASSFTVALAVHAGHHGWQRQIVLWIALTMLLGLGFLGIKAYEYHLAAQHGHVPVPGAGFTYDGPHPEQVRLFMGFYFTMTGVHAAHMVIGLGVWSAVLVQAARGRYTAEYSNPVEVSGLYWHFVDLVWIFLFPVLYLLY